MTHEKVKCPICGKMISRYNGFLLHFSYYINIKKDNKHKQYMKKTPAPKTAQKASPNPAKALTKANVKTTFGTPKKTK